MKIRFQTTIDDIVAFNRFHLANSPAFRRQVWVQTLIIPGIFVALLFLAYWNHEVFIDEEIFLCMIGAPAFGVAIFFTFAMRWYIYWQLGRTTRRFLAEGANRIMLGWRELELRDNRLHLTAELLQSSIDLRAIEKIVGNEEYTFIYIASTSAYIIPMHRYAEEDVREFVADLLDAWDEREAPRHDDESSLPREADERIVERPR